MKTVEFKFDIDQRVKVRKLGFIGIVRTCAFHGAGNDYIQTKKGGNWLSEELLEDAEGDNA
jgi:hypothetical protein